MNQVEDRNYTNQTRIKRPVADVYSAIVSSETITKYFTDKTSGPLVEGEKVIWFWEGWGDHPVIVRKVTENKLIHIELDSKEWKKTEDVAYPVAVIFEFEETEGGTLLKISEQGWRTDKSGLRGSHDNCSGWTHMAICLKVFLEHGIDIRK